jgi:antitoxin component of MazEF toxin-antitoxin module
MIRTCSKVGNSQGVAFDSTHMDLTQLKLGAEINLHIQGGNTITLTPVRARSSRQEMSQLIQSTVNDYTTAMKRSF